MNRRSFLFSAFCTAAGFAAGYAVAVYLHHDDAPPSGLSGAVTRIYDGDTFHIGKRPARIYGIDAPELRQSCNKNGEKVLCGQFAREALREIIGGRDLVCEEKSYSFNRVVAVCMAGKTDIGAEMVRRGYAFADIKYAKGVYKPQEAEAKNAKAGLWGMGFETPDHWRLCNLAQNKHKRPDDCAPKPLAK